MPVICLYQKSQGFYLKGCFTVYVSENSYKLCSLFKCFKHTPYRSKKGCIFIYKSRNSDECLTLSNAGTYLCACLQCVDVYYNQHDPVKRPLVLVFQFKKTDGNGDNNVQNKYYRMSCFDTDKNGGKTKSIDQLCQYDNDESILCPLIEENDRIPGLLTYDIMKRPTGDGDGGSANCTYNCGKIQVTDDTSTNNDNGPTLTGTEFKRFKHAPCNNAKNGHANKPACIIYRCQTLVAGTDGDQAQAQKELPDIQGKTYKHVSVYFGCKAKRKGTGATTAGKGQTPGQCTGTGDCTAASQGSTCKPGSSTCTPGESTCAASPACTATPAASDTTACSQDVPLLLELHKNGSSGDNFEYYVHRRITKGGDKYYWVKLPCPGATNGGTCANGDKCTLKNLLDDIGLHTTKNSGAGHNNGYKTLEKLLKQINGNGSDDANGLDLCQLINKANGSKLQNLLKANVNGDSGSQNGDPNHALITLLLQRIQFDIIDSVIILLDKNCKNAHNGVANGYGESEVSTAVSNLQPTDKQDRINVLKVGNGTGDNGNGKPITVKCVTCSDNGDTSPVCKCLNQYGYCLIEHDFEKAVNGKLGQGCSAGLRLLIPAMGNGGGSSNGQNTTKYQELRLYEGDSKTGPEHLQYLYYRNGVSGGSGACTTACTTSTAAQAGTSTCSKLYVVFYKGVTNTGRSSSPCKGDPRPLLLCYNGCWYRPKNKEGYFDTWVKVDVGEKGPCSCDGSDPPACPKHEKLLCELTKVVGFLNQVNLWQRPNGTTGGQTCQPAGTSGPGTPTTCNNGPNGKCTYNVHRYNGSDVKVQVECCPVTNTPSAESTAPGCNQGPGSGCYKKLTHKPIGTSNGGGAQNGSGYRLGDVVYCGNGCTGGKCRINYYGNGSTGSVGNGNVSADHKWQPLVSVTAYFYNEDKGYCDPLLVELTFARANGDKEYYRLTCDRAGALTWTRDTACAASAMKSNPSGYLDSIRYCLKQVVKICLEKNKQGDQYALVGRNAKPGTSSANGFQKINGVTNNGQVKVTVCECQCKTLTDRKYKCYQHKLCEALSTYHYKVAGLAFTLPCTKGGNGDGACCVNAGNGAQKVVEIPVCVNGGEGPGGCPSSQSEGGCPSVPPGAATCPLEPAASCPAVTGAPSTCTPGQPTTAPIPPVYYNSCMGDVYVYFYACKNGGTGSCTVSTGTTNTGDTVPLMVKFNGQFYRPCDRDQYFTRWVSVEGVCKTAKAGCKCVCCPGSGAGAGAGTSCGASGAGGPGADCGPDCACCKELAQELDKVNESLNRIDLDPEKATKAGSGTGYGLPEKDGCDKTQAKIRGCTLASTVGNNRVCLTKQEPKNGGSGADKAYVKVVHRTKNGFRIGDITYCGHDFAKNGVNLGLLNNGQTCSPGTSGAAQTCNAGPPTNGTTKIGVANGSKPNGNNNHKTLATSCGWNTVVVYYSCTDTTYSLPQLIVVLKTDTKVESSAPVKSSNGNKKYGYYILASPSTGGGGAGGGASGSGYEYQWRTVNDGQPPVTLNEATDFRLLNAAIILLERRKGTCLGGSYNDREISQALKTATSVRSPGNDNEVNRLTGKEITVKDETETGASGDGTHKCIKDTGFKVMSHNLDQLVKLNGQFKGTLSKVTLITGLKLLIPTAEKGKYKQVQLQANGNSRGVNNGNIKYHQNGQDKVCVFFYDKDPRPLFLCYNSWAYKPKSRASYFNRWFKDSKINKCDCSDKCKEELLKALVEVSDFLNPVDIKLTPKSDKSVSPIGNKCGTYIVHWFNGQGIWIKVESKPADGDFCYNQYTHTHHGTCKTDKNGFRLGTIDYGCNCIKENGANGNGKCISASDVNNNGDTKPKTYKSASPEVVVFYYKGDKNHEHPLLVALRNPDWCFYYNTYFELTKKFRSADTKLYKKNNGKEALDVSDTSAGGQLAQTLDNILFTISKKLQIVLSTRPVPTEYKAPADKNGLITDVFDTVNGDKSSRKKAAKLLFTQQLEALEAMAKEADEAKKNATESNKPRYATRDALMHHVTGSTTYEAKLCDKNNGASEPPSGPTQITVTQVTCDKLYSEAGYRCFKHDLTGATSISEVGGLVLCLWVQKGAGGARAGNGKCKPCDTQGGKGQGTQTGLELCDGQPTSNGNGDKCTNGQKGETGCKNGKTGKKVDLHYNVCKGNLYVFFYGDYGSKVTLKRVLQNNFKSFIYIHEYINIFNN